MCFSVTVPVTPCSSLRDICTKQNRHKSHHQRSYTTIIPRPTGQTPGNCVSSSDSIVDEQTQQVSEDFWHKHRRQQEDKRGNISPTVFSLANYCGISCESNESLAFEFSYGGFLYEKQERLLFS